MPPAASTKNFITEISHNAPSYVTAYPALIKNNLNRWTKTKAAEFAAASLPPKNLLPRATSLATALGAQTSTHSAQHFPGTPLRGCPLLALVPCFCGLVK